MYRAKVAVSLSWRKITFLWNDSEHRVALSPRSTPTYYISLCKYRVTYITGVVEWIESDVRNM